MYAEPIEVLGISLNAKALDLAAMGKLSLYSESQVGPAIRSEEVNHHTPPET